MMNDKEIIKFLTPTGIWLRSHLIYLGAFILVISGLGSWVIFNDVASAEASVWREFSEIARNLGLLLLGVIGLPLAIWRSVVASSQAKTAIRQSEHTAKQIELTQQSQMADIFQKAAEMLGNEESSVREAGILALKEVARTDSPKVYYFAIQELLCSYARYRSARDFPIVKETIPPKSLSDIEPPKDLLNDNFEGIPPTSRDIEMAVRAFSDLRSEENLRLEKAAHWEPSLKQVYLAGLDIYPKPMNFQYCDLSGAIFTGADLEEANFENAFLEWTQFMKADLTLARFRNAEMTKTFLMEAQLSTGALDEAYVDDIKLNNVRYI